MQGWGHSQVDARHLVWGHGPQAWLLKQGQRLDVLQLSEDSEGKHAFKSDDN